MTLENVQLRFRLGDTWTSEPWAVLVDDEPVDLAADGWTVRCQARRRWSDEVLQEWSTDNGLIQLGVTTVEYGDPAQSGETSTIRLKHSAAESDSWDPFSSDFEIEIERGTGADIERHTIVYGRVTGYQDIADT